MVNYLKFTRNYMRCNLIPAKPCARLRSGAAIYPAFNVAGIFDARLRRHNVEKWRRRTLLLSGC